MIYFMAPVLGGPIKIGFSDDVDARRRQIEQHYGRPLALLATMPGGREEETAIHERFNHLRLGRTEQFLPAPELLDFIGQPLLVGPNPEAVEAMKASKVDIRFQVDSALYHRIRYAADQECNSVATFIRAAVVRDLKRREKEDGGE